MHRASQCHGMQAHTPQANNFYTQGRRHTTLHAIFTVIAPNNNIGLSSGLYLHARPFYSSYDACLFLATFHFYRATLCQRCVYYGPASVTHKSGSISKMVQDRDSVLQPTNRKGYVACRIAPFPPTLNELQRHSYTASLFKCDFSYSCASVDSISTDIERRAVPLQ